MIYSIPKAAVTDSDEGGESITPSVGDQVDLMNVVAMITGEDGDNFQVEITAVNGSPIEAPAEAPTDMRAAMEQMDAMD
jgi:hypothetical protein